MKTTEKQIMWIRALLLTAACVLAEPAGAGTRHALLIGIDRYAADSGLPRLNYASADVQQLAAVLEQCGYEKEDVHILQTAVSETASQPTKSNILKELHALTRSSMLTSDDVILIVFAGHGFNSNGDSYLCPLDYQAKSPETSAIRVAEIGEELAKAPSGQKYVVIDACRNEVIADETREFNLYSGLRKMQLSEGSSPQGIMFISSCLAGQQSYEDAELQNGVFLHYFTKGIEGYADYYGNFDGKVSAFEVVEYAAMRTHEFVQPKYDASQRPWADSHSTADLCLSDLTEETRKQLTEELGDVQKIAPETVRQNALKLVARQQAEEEIDEAIGTLAIGELQQTLSRATRAIDYDGEYYMARRLRALMYVLEGNKNPQTAARNYRNAVADMLAVKSHLRIRLPGNLSELPIKSQLDTIATAKPGDVLHVNKVVDHGGKVWLQVAGVRRRLTSATGSNSIEKLVGFVPLSSLATPSSSGAQVEDLYRSPKPTQLDVVQTTAQGSGARLDRASNTLHTTTGVLSQIPYANRAAPYTGMAAGIVDSVRQGRSSGFRGFGW